MGDSQIDLNANHTLESATAISLHMLKVLVIVRY